MSSIGDFIVSPDLIGSKTETAPANDTASSGLNGRLQRIAQRLTSLIAQFPATLGQKLKAASLAVTLASDDDLVAAIGAKTDAKSSATDGTSVSGISLWKQISASVQSFATKGQQLKSSSLPFTLASDDDLLGRIGEVQGSPTSNTVLDRLKALLTGTVLAAGENVIGKTAGYGFDVVVAPTVTNGAYSAGDIMGGLMTFTVARANDEAVLINEIQIAFKSAVTPSLLLVLLEADPTGTTKTDNAAYSLAVADVFKVRAALPVNSINGYLTDHGTPNTIRVPDLNLVMKPVSGGKDIYLLMIDQTGVTLTSTADVQVRVCGVGA